MYKFTINHDLITLNEYILNERKNKFEGSTIKKRFTGICQLYAQQLPTIPNITYNVILVHHEKDNRRDTDNIAFRIKFILDGIVKAGKLPDDGYKYINDLVNIRNKSDVRKIDVYLYPLNQKSSYLQAINKLSNESEVES